MTTTSSGDPALLTHPAASASELHQGQSVPPALGRAKTGPYLVPRTCTQHVEKDRQAAQQGDAPDERKAPRVCPIEDLRPLGAYVLLGDPGLGKSRAFEQEAAACGAIYRTARDFLALPQGDLSGQTIFIDGLDESRAGATNGSSTLDAIRARLALVGHPRFRISCREADWFGAPDGQALRAVAPDHEISVFHLDRLTSDQVTDILSHPPHEVDGHRFLAEATQRGLGDLLFNPQTLQLLAEAVRGKTWPATKAETFELAVQNMVREANPEHQAVLPTARANAAAILDAAGCLCALQLVADLAGFVVVGNSYGRTFALHDIALIRDLPAEVALKTRLFTATAGGLFTPAHRSIAEYLGARYLANLVKDQRLPVGRVQALICGPDGHPISALRALNAWLSFHSPAARHTLIATDPLGVLIYGDVRRFTVSEKRTLLNGLRLQAPKTTWFPQDKKTEQRFGALGTPDMLSTFAKTFESRDRDEGSQIFLDYLLSAIRYGEPVPNAKAMLMAVIKDATYLEVVRLSALKALADRWTTDDLGAVGRSITDGSLADDEDELLGFLLRRLYPETITAANLMDYLHAPKRENLYGTYLHFWSVQIVELTPDDKVPALLDAFVRARTSGAEVFKQPRRLRLGAVIGRLIARALGAWREADGVEALYSWLATTNDLDQSAEIEGPEAEAICNWLQKNPRIHLALHRMAIERSHQLEKPRWAYSTACSGFHGAVLPQGMGSVFLDYACAESDDERAEWLFIWATNLLFENGESSGLTLEELTSRSSSRPSFKVLLERISHCPLDEMMEFRWQRLERQRQEESGRAKHALQIRASLDDLVDGSASTGLLEQLAQAYLGHDPDRQGDTPDAQLSYFLNHEADLVAAAQRGLRLVVSHADLPSAESIADLAVAEHMNIFQFPVLVAVQMIHADGEADFLSRVPEHALRAALAFDLVTGQSKEHAWRTLLASNRPELVAEVLVIYAQRLLNADAWNVGGLYQLTHAAEYQQVAKHALLPLIQGFPRRATLRSTNNYLFDLLLAAVKLIDPALLRPIVDERLSDPSISSTQRLCFLICGLLISPADYLQRIQSFVCTSRARQRRLGHLLANRSGVHGGVLIPDAKTLAWMLTIFLPATSANPFSDSFVRTRLRSGFVHELINALAQIGTPEAATCFLELLKLNVDERWHKAVSRAAHTQRTVLREATFRYPEMREVVSTLSKGGPANAADLAAVTLVELESLALRASSSNTDQYKAYWNLIEHGRLGEPRRENDCRDHLVERLHDRLGFLGIEVQPEADYARDKRADIRVSYTGDHGTMAIPIEVKRSTHKDVWHAATTQLDDLYLRDMESAGQGIYLVFWFGAKDVPTSPNGTKPTTASEMKAELDALLPEDSRGRISICVMDCSGD